VRTGLTDVRPVPRVAGPRAVLNWPAGKRISVAQCKDRSQGGTENHRAPGRGLVLRHQGAKRQRERVEA